MKSIRPFVISILIFILAPGTVDAEILNPGDGVRITFYNISDATSGDFFIQQDSSLQLPYIGMVNTTLRDYTDLKNEITVKYDSLYRGVELMVSPLYKINVLGEVRRPGVYFVTGVEKLLDVIAMAGGETEDSDMSEILLQRRDITTEFDAEDIIRGNKNAKDFYLKSGDRIYVTRRWWVAGQNITFLFTAASLVVTLIAVFGR